MPRNRLPQPAINAAPTLNPNTAPQAGLTRRILKHAGRAIARSPSTVGRVIKRAGENIKQDVHELTHPELGIVDMAIAGLLVGVPVGATYSAVKLPEWIHAGRQWFEKNVVKISDEVKDWLFLDTLEGYANGAQWARKFIGAEKAKK